MNRLVITGNLTRDPELRTTQQGINVCSFTVAVNRRKTQNNQNPEADYFQVTAWRELGENCARYLAKGRKVLVIGPVSGSAYTANDGSARSRLEIQAHDVEFLSSRGDADGSGAQGTHAAADENIDPQSGFAVVEPEELPYP